jgi:hypothetical protein
MSPTGSLQVRTVTLDDLVGREGVPVPDFLKIDVEGSEVSVLRGAETVLSIPLPAILLSTHGRSVHEECCRNLSARGYDVRVGSDCTNRRGEMRGEVLARRKG